MVLESKILKESIRRACSQYIQLKQFLVCFGDFQVLVHMWDMKKLLEIGKTISVIQLDFCFSISTYTGF